MLTFSPQSAIRQFLPQENSFDSSLNATFINPKNNQSLGDLVGQTLALGLSLALEQYVILLVAIVVVVAVGGGCSVVLAVVSKVVPV